jgi:ABC-type transport system involved in cytochrome bd biosynthesis fused ATPase/permease subunit
MDDVLDVGRERTILLITHRPEGLERMDELDTIDSGARVAERIDAGHPSGTIEPRLVTP